MKRRIRLIISSFLIGAVICGSSNRVFAAGRDTIIFFPVEYVDGSTDCAFAQGRNGKYYWYEGGIRQGTYSDPKGVLGDGTVRGREICDMATEAWYWLDSCYDGAKACNKEVWMPYIFHDEHNWNSDRIKQEAAICGTMAAQVERDIKAHTGKWVRYDADGKMVKGWYTVQGADAAIYTNQVGNTYYYDPITGLMAKGTTKIDGKIYHFDDTTGVLIK